MNWWWTDDELMMSWWWADDELMMIWWWTDDELMKNWWWTDNEMTMNRWWTADELMMSGWDGWMGYPWTDWLLDHLTVRWQTAEHSIISPSWNYLNSLDLNFIRSSFASGRWNCTRGCSECNKHLLAEFWYSMIVRFIKHYTRTPILRKKSLMCCFLWMI